jgi:hypothetical protein
MIAPLVARLRCVPGWGQRCPSQLPIARSDTFPSTVHALAQPPFSGAADSVSAMRTRLLVTGNVLDADGPVGRNRYALARGANARLTQR